MSELDDLEKINLSPDRDLSVARGKHINSRRAYRRLCAMKRDYGALIQRRNVALARRLPGIGEPSLPKFSWDKE